MTNGADRGRDLVALRRVDEAKRAELIDRGELFDGYHAEMEAVHRANARALEAMLDQVGRWPCRTEVGREAADAAFVVATHAIGEPAFQRRCLELLAVAVEAGEADPAHAAMLHDRICFNERRPQRFGSILDWDANDRMAPWLIEHEAGVDGRREAVGLPPLAEHVQRVRAEVAAAGGRPPKPYEERQAELDAWARRVGWTA